VLTLVFATYAIVLAPSLLLFGLLSDRFGRRAVISGGLAAAVVGLTLFAVARSTASLVAALPLHSLAVMVAGALLAGTGHSLGFLASKASGLRPVALPRSG
jgi:MFS family permease